MRFIPLFQVVVLCPVVASRNGSPATCLLLFPTSKTSSVEYRALLFETHMSVAEASLQNAKEIHQYPQLLNLLLAIHLPTIGMHYASFVLAFALVLTTRYITPALTFVHGIMVSRVSLLFRYVW